MLYEPPKTKRYILIGASAVILAVLVVAFLPLLFKNKTTQTPVSNLSSQRKLQQEKIQKESQKLDQIRESSGAKDFTPEEINQQSQKLDDLRNQMVK
jgi:hypothetical protein